MCATPSHSSEFGSSTHSELILSENNNIPKFLIIGILYIFWLEYIFLKRRISHTTIFFWQKKSDHCVIYGYVWRLTRWGERETHSVQKCTKRFTSSIEMYSSLKLARKNIQTVELSFANNNRKTITVAHISIPKSIPSWAQRRQEWQYHGLHYYTWCVCSRELTIWIYKRGGCLCCQQITVHDFATCFLFSYKSIKESVTTICLKDDEKQKSKYIPSSLINFPRFRYYSDKYVKTQSNTHNRNVCWKYK